MISRIRAAVAAFMVGLVFNVACGPALPTDPPLPVPDDYGDTCDRAEVHLAACPWARPSPHGERFGAVCRQMAESHALRDPGCLLSASSCAAAEACR